MHQIWIRIYQARTRRRKLIRLSSRTSLWSTPTSIQCSTRKWASWKDRFKKGKCLMPRTPCSASMRPPPGCLPKWTKCSYSIKTCLLFSDRPGQVRERCSRPSKEFKWSYSGRGMCRRVKQQKRRIRLISWHRLRTKKASSQAKARLSVTRSTRIRFDPSLPQTRQSSQMSSRSSTGSILLIFQDCSRQGGLRLI